MFPANLAYSGFYAVYYRVPAVIFPITWHNVCHIVIAVAVLSESIMVKFSVFTSLSCIVWDSQYSVYHVPLLNNTDIRSVLSCQSF